MSLCAYCDKTFPAKDQDAKSRHEHEVHGAIGDKPAKYAISRQNEPPFGTVALPALVVCWSCVVPMLSLCCPCVVPIRVDRGLQLVPLQISARGILILPTRRPSRAHGFCRISLAPPALRPAVPRCTIALRLCVSDQVRMLYLWQALP